MNEEIMKALEEDGETLRALTGKDHGPIFLAHSECCGLLDIVTCGGCPLRQLR